MPQSSIRRKCRSMVLVAVAVLVVLGCIVWILFRADSAPQDYRSLIQTNGMPLFVCSRYETVPFEGGVTAKLTQITFYGFKSVPDLDTPIAGCIAVYSDDPQLMATVEMFQNDQVNTGVTERLASFYPSPEFNLFHINESGDVVLHKVETMMHVLLIVD